jgi:hypothetical protein
MGCYPVVGGGLIVLSFLLSSSVVVAFYFYLLSSYGSSSFSLPSPTPSHVATTKKSIMWSVGNSTVPTGARKLAAPFFRNIKLM